MNSEFRVSKRQSERKLLSRHRSPCFPLWLFDVAARRRYLRWLKQKGYKTLQKPQEREP